jgi:two-component system sensor histidine kinase and response regulator WspE
VIVVSYKDREEDRLAGLEAGATAYLTKGSFQDSSFADTVRDLVDVGRAGGSPA